MLFAIMLFFFTNSLMAQEYITTIDSLQFEIDDEKLKVEDVDKNKLKNLKESGDFEYWVEKEKGFDLWSVFWRWFSKIIRAMFSNEGVAPYIRYLVIFLVLSFVIYKVVGGSLSGVFSKNKKVKSANGFDYFEEDIHQDDIDRKLSEAIMQKDFRTAIRFYYLILLRKLDEGSLIEWEQGKTNREYQYELKNNELLDDFIKLSGMYEYSWYGNFEVDENRFVKWQDGFKNVFSTIPEA